ncbi:MAG: lysophospholipid acyltransferase family protein [Propionibacteriaceae bacterium]|nr:lysophospholipid acyltransferase family protein [Propionibacteriaceae bacterium]
MNWYGFFKVPFRLFVKHGYKATITGAENIPRTGGVILASNHVSYADTFLTPALIDRQVTLPVKAEVFQGDQGLKWAVIGAFLKAVGMVPLDRSGRGAVDGLGPVIEALRQGRVVGIYPEGTRSPDGRLYQGKTGVARLALTTGAPVVPVGILDAEITGTRFGINWVDRPRIVVGEPLDFSAWKGMEDDRAMGRWVTDEVMAAIQQLTGQTYVKAYAASVKSGSMDAAEADRRIQDRPGGGPAPKPPVAGLS